MAKQSDAAIDDFPVVEEKASVNGASIQVEEQSTQVQSPSEQLISALNSDSKTIQNIFIEQKKGIGNVTIHHGNTPNADIAKSNKFFAQHKKLTLFITDSLAVSFRDRMFYTDKPELINELRNNPSFKTLYWESEFPDWFKKKLEKRSESLTKDPDAYN